jgi:hypothetical protein
MTDRFLGIGINAYPGAPLRGCIPDIQQCCDLVVGGWGASELNFSWRDLAACTDRRAHAEGFRARLIRLVAGAKPGDRLLFWYSGHGSQVPIRSDYSGEIDDLTEVLCPYDFSYDDEDTWIIDADFIDVFGSVPPGVNCVVVLDSCFSGGMVNQRAIGNVPTGRAYPIDSCIDFSVRLNGAKQGTIKPDSLIKTPKIPNVAFVLGCQEEQTCADAMIKEEYRGALSFYLWSAIAAFPDKSLADVVKIAARMLKNAEFNQVPSVVGPADLLSKPFMSKL